MWSDRAQRRTVQPELPLDEVSAPPSGNPSGEWRLDEHTRRVGRAGVAAARARLTAPVPGREVPTAPAPPGAGTRPDQAVASAEDRAA